MDGVPSFAAVVDGLVPRALRTARALLGSERYVAEDAVQEALLRALRAWPALPDKTGDPWPWLRTIVVHECRRQHRRLGPAGTADMAPEIPDGGPGPLECLLDAEERAEAVRALAGLGGAFRTAAELFYVHGLSCPEVAAVLGTPVGTVKWRLHTARTALRRLLLEDGDDAGRIRPEPRAPVPPLPPLRWAPRPADPAPTAVAERWPPDFLEVPAGHRVRFVVPSRVGGGGHAAWASTHVGHHLWWQGVRSVWRASGGAIGELRALAEGVAAGGR